MLDLSQQQKAAVQYIKGPLLVLGGAGSGKTSLLAYKIAWLIRDYDVAPAHIFAIVANAPAVRSMRASVCDLLGRQVPDLSVSTFSELGHVLIQQRLDAIGLLPGFSLYDSLDSEALVSRLLRETHPSHIGLAGAVTQQIAGFKRDLMAPVAGNDAAVASATEVAAALYRRYEQRLRTANAVDVEDLVRKAVRLLTTDAELITAWRGRIRFLLVDEYERTSPAEHELVRLLAADGISLTAAGDENQILRARATGQPDILSRLATELAELRIVKLDRNFRSSARIARSAATLIGRGRPASDAVPASAAALGARLRVLHTRSDHHEADGIVRALLDHQGQHENDYRHYAILVPRLEQTAALERALQAHRVPYYVRGGPSLFDQTEVRDLWAYLKLLCNPSDDIAFLRAINTPRRDIDRTTLESLTRFAADRGRPLLESALDPALAQTLTPRRFTLLHNVATLLQAFSERTERANPVQLVYDLIGELRYDEWLRDTCNDIKIAERRMQNVMELVSRLRRLARHTPAANLHALVTRLNLSAILDPEGHELAADGVALMPLAVAKGLEFAHVYLVGFEEGLLPVTAGAQQDLETERRRAYIAISRARETLTFALVEQRSLAGELAARRPSRFLAELSPEDLESINAVDGYVNAETMLGRSANRPEHLQPRRYR